ncbi:MAG TPA: DNA polymerase I [Actinobacteria bacterium]|nr:DNA polymerase I [Actinomycetota bacterium]
MKKRLILIDSNNIAYRAFYALPVTITTSSGAVTNAVYGFISMVLKIAADFEPDNIIAAFDSKAPTFRHDFFEGYKAQRKKMPEELISQMPLIKEVLKSMKIPTAEIEGFEADDIIATIVSKCRKSYEEIMIISSDKDMLQLVGGNIKVIALKKGMTDVAVFDSDSVYEKFNVSPGEIKDYLALTGDSSDNIPGIPGIGPKTASGLISQFKSIDNMYKNIGEIKSEKLAELITRNKSAAEFSKKLTELADDIDLDIESMLEYSIRDADVSDIQKSFEMLEFKTLSERIRKIAVFKNNSKEYERFSLTSSGQNHDNHDKSQYITNKEKETINCRILKNPEDADEFFKKINEKIYFSIISHFNGDISDGQDAGKILSIFNGNNEMLLIHESRLDDSACLNILKRIFENNDLVKVGFDIKNSYKWLKEHNIGISGSINDLKIFFLLLNSSKTDTNIEEIFQKYSELNSEDILVSFGKISFKDIRNGKPAEPGIAYDSKKENRQMSLIGYDGDKEKSERFPDDFEDINVFSDFLQSNIYVKKQLGFLLFFSLAEDALISELKEQEMSELYRNIEEPLIKVLAEMEYTGVAIDKEYLKVLIAEYEKEIEIIKKQIFEASGEEFNINSPQQLSKILYQKLNLKPRRKTKTGLSTDASTLLSLLDSNPVIEKILDYREKVKLKNTYIDVLPNITSKKDGRIHTTYNQLGTTTGRISSSDPNLQNIPVRTDIGKLIRKAFIPGKGYDLILSADYSQIELRILAHLSHDKKLIEVFLKDEDIHSYTASEIFNVKPENVTEEMRRKAKAINFGIIYGMTEYGLKSRLSITEEEAKDYIELYFSRYPEIKGYISSLIKKASEKGYAETLFGRKRNIPELLSPNPRIRNLGERLAINTPIQGTAADIMKLATVRLFNNLKESGTDANILMQVHDELVLEIKEKDLEIVKKSVKISMEDCIKLEVPLKTDIKYSVNWYI